MMNAVQNNCFHHSWNFPLVNPNLLQYPFLPPFSYGNVGNWLLHNQLAMNHFPPLPLQLYQHNAPIVPFANAIHHLNPLQKKPNDIVVID